MSKLSKPAAAPRPAPLRSRRKPRLRVVGSAGPPRHAAVVRLGWTTAIIEVVTFDEWLALPPGSRPSGSALPGLGVLTARKPIGEHEVEDIRDVSQQAADAFYAAMD